MPHTWEVTGFRPTVTCSQPSWRSFDRIADAAICGGSQRITKCGGAFGVTVRPYDIGTYTKCTALLSIDPRCEAHRRAVTWHSTGLQQESVRGEQRRCVRTLSRLNG